MASSSGIWVFGYGSLVWNPGFDFVRSQVGYIRGYDRRFWQGNDKHRGTPDKGQVWGRAFLLREDDESARASLNYLDERETRLGGYCTRFVQFRPRDPREEPFPALIYIATPNNKLYLGPAGTSRLADEIVAARGFCGANAEYVLKLASFMKQEVPDAWDDHLFALEAALRSRLNDTWELLEEMSSYEAPVSAGDWLASVTSSDDEDEERKNGDEAVAGDFVSNVASRQLRCLNI
ncbi:glutathione-specific gamma-glutamylcyclotransferase 1 isoform X2 [Haemaphysalis longicornis]